MYRNYSSPITSPHPNMTSALPYHLTPEPFQRPEHLLRARISWESYHDLRVSVYNFIGLSGPFSSYLLNAASAKARPPALASSLIRSRSGSLGLGIVQ